jgi:hypothetical protein
MKKIKVKKHRRKKRSGGSSVIKSHLRSKRKKLKAVKSKDPYFNPVYIQKLVEKSYQENYELYPGEKIEVYFTPNTNETEITIVIKEKEIISEDPPIESWHLLVQKSPYMEGFNYRIDEYSDLPWSEEFYLTQEKISQLYLDDDELQKFRDILSEEEYFTEKK